jgi:hypothetical protein
VWFGVAAIPAGSSSGVASVTLGIAVDTILASFAALTLAVLYFSPGERPRRRQVPVSEEDRDRIERHLERMPLELRPAGRQPSANADIEALRADGALDGEQTYKLVQLRELCDRLRHAYAYVDAADVHTAVHALLKLWLPMSMVVPARISVEASL